jgi:hypothetical protein
MALMCLSTLILNVPSVTAISFSGMIDFDFTDSKALSMTKAINARFRLQAINAGPLHGWAFHIPKIFRSFRSEIISDRTNHLIGSPDEPLAKIECLAQHCWQDDNEP